MRFLLHDTKFSTAFDNIFVSESLEIVLPLPIQRRHGAPGSFRP
jgi:hypothetical protein